VYAAGWDGQSPFTPVYQRLREDPSWRTYALDSGHNLMRDAPQDLLKILFQVVDPADGEDRDSSTARAATRAVTTTRSSLWASQA
jgi:hypothetical protein